MFPASTKASSGLSLCFPDVCKTPVPITGTVPLPFPNIAKTATQSRQKQTKGGSKTTTKKGPTSRFSANEPGTMKGVVSGKMMQGAKPVAPSTFVQHEVQGLKGMLNQLNSKLQGLKTNDPNEWQSVLQEYTVAASALYVTLNDS